MHYCNHEAIEKVSSRFTLSRWNNFLSRSWIQSDNKIIFLLRVAVSRHLNIYCLILKQRMFNHLTRALCARSKEEWRDKVPVTCSCETTVLLWLLGETSMWSNYLGYWGVHLHSVAVRFRTPHKYLVFDIYVTRYAGLWR